jgi:hypothetical protein
MLVFQTLCGGKQLQHVMYKITFPHKWLYERVHMNCGMEENQMLDIFTFLVVMLTSMCYKELRQTLNFNSHENIFIGYSDEMKGYKFYDSQNKKLITNHDVIFDETISLQISRTMQGG